MAFTDSPFPGTPTVFGNKVIQAMEHAGPASYTTGGETITASQFGWGGFELVDLPIGLAASGLGNTYSGTYLVMPIYATASGIYGALSTVKLKWIVAATGAEVANAVNLASEVVRVRYQGV